MTWGGVMLRRGAAALILSIICTEAVAQETPSLPDEVALTNSVEGHRFARLEDAIARGDTAQVLAMGGELKDAAAAIGQKLSHDRDGRWTSMMQRFGDVSDGARLQIGQIRVQGALQPALQRVGRDGSIISVTLDGENMVVNGDGYPKDAVRVINGD